MTAGAHTGGVHSARGAGGGACNAPLPCSVTFCLNRTANDGIA